MANIFKRVVIKTSIGKMVFEYLYFSSNSSGRIQATKENFPVMEGSTCACISNFGSGITNAVTDAFTIEGKSGANYNCRKQSNNQNGYDIQLYLGASAGWRTIFGYAYTSSDKLIRLPYFSKYDYGENDVRYGLTYENGVLRSNSLFSAVTNSQVTATQAGYYVAETKTDLNRTLTFGGYASTSEACGIIKDILDGAKDFDPDPDPYEEAGETEPGGGTGDFDDTGDDVDIPALPTLSAVDTGFITLFNPSIGQLNALATFMWTNPLFDITNWKRIFADPMDAILGLSLVPVSVPNGAVKTVTVGNISTDVSMTVAASQYVALDCGTLNVNEFWGGYLDYSPYTKVEIYLPYIGTHPLDVDDVMGKAVHVVYHVDILSGACCAYVKCGGSVLYTFSGQCASSIPITGNDWTNVINGILSIAASAGTLVASGGAAAPIVTGIASTAINQMKPQVEKSGSMGGTGGMMGIQTPYLILTRPRQALPANQNEYTGYPSFIAEPLDSLHGYTEIEYIHLDNVHATDGELSEIESILKTGVII